MFGSSVMTYRGRDFEFFREDAMSPTLASWMVEEWRDIDGRLRAAFSLFLAANLRVRTELGHEPNLIMTLLPVSDMQRVEKGDIEMEEGAAFCSDAPLKGSQ